MENLIIPRTPEEIECGDEQERRSEE